MKVLLIYEYFGQGHRRVADIVHDALKNRADVSVVAIPGAELFEDRTVLMTTKVSNYLCQHNHLGIVDSLLNSPVEEAAKVVRVPA